jgi:chromosome segregation ATPase
LEVEKEKLEFQITSIKREATTVLAEKDNHEAEVSDMYKHVTSLKKQLSSKEEQMNQLFAENKAAVEESERAYSKLDSRRRELEESNASLQAKNTDVHDRLSALELELEKEELDSQITSIEREATAVLLETNSQAAKLSHMDQQVILSQKQFSSKEEQMNQLRVEKETGVEESERAHHQEIRLPVEEASKNLETLSSEKGGLQTPTSDHQDTNIELDSLRQDLAEANTPLQAESRDEHDHLSALEEQKADLESQITSINEALPVLAEMDHHASMLTNMHRHVTSLQKQLSSTEEQMNQLRAEKEAVVEERERAYRQEIQLSLEGASRTLAALRSKEGDVLAATLRSCSRDSPLGKSRISSSPLGKSRISSTPPRVRFAPTQRTKGQSYE